MSIEQQSRRDFLKTGALAAAGFSLLSNDLFAGGKKPVTRNIGVQLWSVKDDMAKDAAGTLAKVAKMGYKQVEGFGYDDGKFFGLSADIFIFFWPRMTRIASPVRPSVSGADFRLTKT